MTNAPKHKLLLVEDDENLAYVIKDNLEHAGFEIELSSDGADGLERFGKSKFALCILDVMLPKLDGFTLAEKIRQLDKNVPLIFLTAKSMKEDRLNGFAMGADDYITKPFSIEELVWRIKVFLKRSGSGQQQNQIHTLNAYVFDYANMDLIHPKVTKHLTQREADLLNMLCQNAGRMVKREEILKQVWGTDDYFAGRSMDVFISKLRKYLAHDTSIEIENYHGTGFKLNMGEAR